MSREIQGMSKAELAAFRAEDRLKGKNAYEVIREWYMSDLTISLNEKQEEIRRRIEQAHTYLHEARMDPDIVNLLQKEFDISHATAYKDLRWAKVIFGDVRKASKEGERRIVYSLAQEVYRLAKKQRDTTEMNRAIKNMIKILGLDKEDADLPDFEKLEPSVYPVVLDESVRELILDFIDGKGSVDISEFYDKMAEDAEIIEEETNDRGADQGEDQ